ncbi:MAG TPA: hypothetical protein EYP08_01395 [Pyrodictiaceae archaeon]|nr:hypothetical protein [Pyrodictiaceae archaeon]
MSFRYDSLIDTSYILHKGFDVEVDCRMSLKVKLEKEVENAWSFVKRQNKRSLENKSLHSAPYVIAVGAGDSYAATLAWEGVEARVRAADPLDALNSGLLGFGIELNAVMVGISVGGQTKSVVEVISRYRYMGGRVFCITGNPLSPLALLCGNGELLVYGKTVEGVGGIRQVVLYAAIAGLRGVIVEEFKPPLEPLNLLKYSIMVGVGASRGVALFASLKLCEVYGVCNNYSTLEELIHSKIYSLRPGSSILVFEPPYRDGRFEEIVDELQDLGYDIVVVKAREGRAWDSVIGQTIWVLESLVKTLEEKEVAKPYYKSNPLLDKLTNIIYFSEQHRYTQYSR